MGMFLVSCRSLRYLQIARPSIVGRALWAGAPAFYAGMHVAAASPASFILEYSLGANPMLHDLVVEKLDVADGTIAIPDAPGLGITVDEDYLRAHAFGA